MKRRHQKSVPTSKSRARARTRSSSSSTSNSSFNDEVEEEYGRDSASSSHHSAGKKGGKSVKIDFNKVSDASQIMKGYSLSNLLNPKTRTSMPVFCTIQRSASKSKEKGANPQKEQTQSSLAMNDDSSKKTKGCRYLQKHTDEFPFIKSSSVSEHHVYCEKCQSNISIKSGGRKDIVSHVHTNAHEKASSISDSLVSSQLVFSAPKSGSLSFEERVSHIVKQSFVGSVLALSHDVGLLQALNNSRQPMTSRQIANSCGLRERYVREALDCLVCAQLVEAGRSRDGRLHYVLPGEAGPALHSLRTQYLNMLPSQMSRYQQIKQCFKEDGPLGFKIDADPIAQSGFERLSHLRVNNDVAVVLENVPGIKEGLELGISVVEFGCGSGKFLSQFAEKFPRSRFLGSEVTQEGVESSISSCQGMSNLNFCVMDILNIPAELDANFDVVLLNLVIHDLSNPVEGFKGCRRVLKKGGYLVLIDVDAKSDVLVNRCQDPEVAIQYAFSTFHCIPETYSGPNEPQPLGCCWGRETAITMARRAGFSITESITKHNLHFHVTICRS